MLLPPEEILEKLGGKCIAEYKYDGERMQVHKDRDKVLLFSTRLENISYQYPDAIELIRQSIQVKSAILETECVAVDPDTGDMRPFQELMHRRDKKFAFRIDRSPSARSALKIPRKKRYPVFFRSIDDENNQRME